MEWSTKSTIATAVGLAPDTWYTNIITDSEGCVPIDSVYVTTPIDLVEITTFTIVDNDCYGETNGAIDISVSGGTPNYDFQWSGPSTNSTNEDVSNLAREFIMLLLLMHSVVK